MPSFDSLLPSDRSADPASIVGRLADAADGEASPPLTIGAPADAEQVPDSIRDDTFDGFEPEVSDRLPLSHPIPGTFINGNALLRTKEPRTTRRGSPYWNLTLGNAEGTIVGKVWTQHYADWTSIAIGAPVWVSGEVKEGWQGGLPELHVRFVEPLPSGHAVSLELNLASPIPLSRLIARWEALLDAMMVPGQPPRPRGDASDWLGSLH